MNLSKMPVGLLCTAKPLIESFSVLFIFAGYSRTIVTSFLCHTKLASPIREMTGFHGVVLRQAHLTLRRLVGSGIVRK